MLTYVLTYLLTKELIAALLAVRSAKRQRNKRRPSLASLKEGATREGLVVALERVGAIVNVGARRTGLIHLSQFDPKGPRPGSTFVNDPSEVSQP